MEKVDNQDQIPDTERWQKGASRYSGFYWSLTPREREELHKTPDMEGRQKNPGDLQAMFLGEKPVIFQGYGAAVNTKLAKAGFGIAGQYVYDRGQVLALLQKHKDVFDGFPLDDPDAFMRTFAQKKFEECHLQRGLLLGYPQSAVKHFIAKGDRDQQLSNILMRVTPDHARAWKKVEEFRVRHRLDKVYWGFQFLRDHLHAIADDVGLSPEEVGEWQRKATQACEEITFDAHGMVWADMPDTPESVQKVRRLKKAFERSGILRVDKRERVNRGMRSVASAISSRIGKLFGRSKQGSH